MTEELAVTILQELKAIRADLAESHRTLKNKIASLRWATNRIHDEVEHLAGLLDDAQPPSAGATPD